jgi:Domain of unknown function (DUF6457)
VDEWLTRVRDAIADAAGIAPSELDLTDDEIDAVLDLAAVAAHESGARTNAPLLCYLVGRAQRGGADLNTLGAAVRRSSS